MNTSRNLRRSPCSLHSSYKRAKRKKSREIPCRSSPFPRSATAMKKVQTDLWRIILNLWDQFKVAAFNPRKVSSTENFIR